MSLPEAGKASSHGLASNCTVFNTIPNLIPNAILTGQQVLDIVMALPPDVVFHIEPMLEGVVRNTSTSDLESDLEPDLESGILLNIPGTSPNSTTEYASTISYSLTISKVGNLVKTK